MIQMLNIRKQFDEIREEILKSVTEVLESGAYILGPKVREFEGTMAKYIGTADAIGVANGTDALHLAVRGLGIGPGDEVITTPFTFFATVESIMYLGAKPVFVDIDPVTYNIDSSKIEERITKNTKAIIPVHIFGHPADMDTIMPLAFKHGLAVIEDCAQAIGAEIAGTRVGSMGNAGCFSFYPSKNLGACGDGGMVTLNDDTLSSAIRKLRNHGSSANYQHEFVGINSRLDEIQAAILLIKLARLEQYNAHRRATAALYNELLSDNITCPTEKAGCKHVYHQYTLRHPERDRIREALRVEDVSSMVYYPTPMHLLPATEMLGYKKGDFPETERASQEVFSLPICSETAEEDVRRIAKTILACV